MLSKKFLVRRSALVAGVLLAASAFSAVRAAEPEVLTKVPADAYGLVVVNNVRTLANKMSNAATRLNLPLPPDLVGYLTRTAGITKGFDANSSAALVLLKPPADRAGQGYFSEQAPFVVLLPTSDAKGMLEPFKPGEPDAKGISQVTMVQDPDEKGFVATVDNKWVAFSQSKDDLAAYLGRTDSFATRASADIRHVFDVNDVVIWGDVQKLGIGADKALDDLQTEIGGMLELANIAGNQDPVAGALQKQGITAVVAFAKQFLKDADASMVTLRLTESGATLGAAGDFKSESTIGRFVAAQKSSKPVSLQGLPSPGAGFLFAGAMNWDPASMSTVMKNFTQTLLADETLAKDPRGADLKKALDLQRQMIEITTGAKFILLDPPAGGKNGFFSGVFLIDSTNPARFQELQSESMRGNFLQDPMNPDIKQQVTVTPDAVTVKGVKLTKMNVKMSLREDTPDKPVNPASRVAIEMAQKIYGPDGMTIYSGVIGTRGIVISGSDAGTLESAVAAAQANTGELASNPLIAASKEQLVANPVAVMYLPITRWVTLASAILKPGGAAETAPSPAISNAPPVVMSAGVTNSLMTAEVHVPIATISGMKEAVARLQAGMNGGGQ
jgi:hypothetical protein